MASHGRHHEGLCSRSQQGIHQGFHNPREVADLPGAAGDGHCAAGLDLRQHVPRCQGVCDRLLHALQGNGGNLIDYTIKSGHFLSPQQFVKDAHVITLLLFLNQVLVGINAHLLADLQHFGIRLVIDLHAGLGHLAMCS